MLHAQVVLAHDRELVLQQQIIITVDAARHRVLNRQQTAFAGVLLHGSEDSLETFAGQGLCLPSEIFQNSSF